MSVIWSSPRHRRSPSFSVVSVRRRRRSRRRWSPFYFSSFSLPSSSRFNSSSYIRSVPRRPRSVRFLSRVRPPFGPRRGYWFVPDSSPRSSWFYFGVPFGSSEYLGRNSFGLYRGRVSSGGPPRLFERRGYFGQGP